MYMSDLCSVWLVDFHAQSTREIQHDFSNCLCENRLWEEDTSTTRIVTYQFLCKPSEGTYDTTNIHHGVFQQSRGIMVLPKMWPGGDEGLSFSKEDYYLPCIVTNVRHYVADMPGRGSFWVQLFTSMTHRP
jgi:hypothetical protein